MFEKLKKKEKEEKSFLYLTLRRFFEKNKDTSVLT